MTACFLKAIDGLHVPRESARAAVDALNAVDVAGFPYAEREVHDDEPDPAQRAVLTFGFSLSGSGYGTHDLAWPRDFEVGGLYADFCDDAEVEAMLKALAPHLDAFVGVVVLAEKGEFSFSEKLFAFVVDDGEVRRVEDVAQEVEVTYVVEQTIDVKGWL